MQNVKWYQSSHLFQLVGHECSHPLLNIYHLLNCNEPQMGSRYTAPRSMSPASHCWCYIIMRLTFIQSSRHFMFWYHISFGQFVMFFLDIKDACRTVVSPMVGWDRRVYCYDNQRGDCYFML